ncbi:MAG: S1C family serine protease [Spirochaetaceae bacterium]|jgi:S1-C subfamily serine protease|nr:S1C family serine protease [Spirochaetaceae bacterium]
MNKKIMAAACGHGMNRLIFFLAALFCSACISIGTRDAYAPPDWTEADSLQAEIARLEEMLPKEPVQTLWRAELLQKNAARHRTGSTDPVYADVDALFAKVAGKVAALQKEAIDKEKWADALRFRRSLAAVGAVSSEDWPDERELEAKLLAGVPGKRPPAPSGAGNTVIQSSSIAQTIAGTVTVWLDLGIKVEHGLGYAASGLGSGFFIDRRGYLITNYHVIHSEVDPKYEGFSRLYIKPAGDPDTKIPARVIGWDPLLDLALLKTEIVPPYVFTLGSSTELDPGERVFAIGSPVGLESTVTSGIVSAVNRKLLSVGGVMQIDAAVNQGNSGGPLIDSNGNVQAIVFAGALQYEGLNFAIPVEYLIDILPQLYQGGKRSQSWIAGYGRTIRNLQDGISGVEVQYVLPGGSASRAAVKEGDIITGVNGKAVGSMEDMQNALIRLPADSITAIAGVHPDGLPFSALVYLAPRPENPGLDVYERDVIARAFMPLFGMELQPLSTGSKKRFSVIRVLKGSIADESGFSTHDPVDVMKVRISKEKDVIYAELFTKKRKNGYFDMSIAIGAPLDSPYYF